jgi:ceramide glucosyltransferase
MLIAGAIAVALYAAIFAAKVVLSARYAATHREDDALGGEITVLQPILGGDPFLEEALRRNLRQPARFLWLVDEDDAEGRRVAGKVAEEAGPRVEIVLCPPAAAGLNPKTTKLQRGLERTGTEYLAVLDDDTILSDGQLGRAMFALRTSTIYTGLPCYLRGGNLWSSLVTHFVNNNSILTYLPLLRMVGPLSINGMFYAMRADALRGMGGFTPIVSQLCDDYALAGLVRRNGGTIRQGITPQFLHTTVPDAGHYVRLMHRWFVFANVLVRDQPARVKLLLVVFLGLPPFLLWLGLLCPPLLIILLAARHFALRKLQRDVLGTLPHLNWLTSIASELLQPLHWLHACVQHTLRWRTRRIVPAADGSFSHDPV